MIKAILFDMDGLLVDTETLGVSVAIEMMKKQGIKLSEDEKNSFIGVTDEKFYRHLFEKHNLSLDVHNVLKEHFLLYEELLRTKLKPFDGSVSAPKKMKSAGYFIGLVSGSTKNQIEIVLQSLGILSFFDVIVSFDDCEKSKPEADCYLKASEQLGVSSAECIVVEDATSGIVSGKNAGMKVVGVINNGGQDLSQADVIIQNLEELNINIVESLV